MIPNLVSAELSDADQAEIMAAINTILEKLPFVVSLTTAERRAKAKMGDKTRAFVEKSMEFAIHHPDYLPRLFDLDEMRRDVELFATLYPVLMALVHLQELVQDTYTVVGQEAYAAARVVYKSAKANGQGAGLDAAIAEMGRRFAYKSGRLQSEAKV
jgi:hypothetical protein